MLGIRGFDLDRVLEMEPSFLDLDAEHTHDASVTSVGFNQVALIPTLTLDPSLTLDPTLTLDLDAEHTYEHDASVSSV